LIVCRLTVDRIANSYGTTRYQPVLWHHSNDNASGSNTIIHRLLVYDSVPSSVHNNQRLLSAATNTG